METAAAPSALLEVGTAGPANLLPPAVAGSVAATLLLLALLPIRRLRLIMMPRARTSSSMLGILSL